MATTHRSSFRPVVPHTWWHFNKEPIMPQLKGTLARASVTCFQSAQITLRSLSTEWYRYRYQRIMFCQVVSIPDHPNILAHACLSYLSYIPPGPTRKVEARTGLYIFTSRIAQTNASRVAVLRCPLPPPLPPAKVFLPLDPARLPTPRLYPLLIVALSLL